MLIQPVLNDNNVELEESIERAIHGRSEGEEVQVVVRDGYVNLLGWVDGIQEKKAIGLMVEAIPGVRMVTNHVHIKPWQEGGVNLASPAFPGLNDVELEKAIEQEIRGRGKKQSVQVVVRNGYVNLLGWVDNLEDKKAIGLMVEGTAGVRTVTNHIHVKSWEEKRNFTHF
jgi:osmotically-inducible protein OsmY